jgi:sterol desaturase/sphingolipid hydroxylase (fatty acid hydroxylase superfamily)
MTMLLAGALGALGWTFAEYVLHRFDGHGMKGRTPFSREHLAHHADPTYFAPSWKKAAAAVVVVSAMGSAGWAVVGLPGIAFAVGFTTMYLTYEVIHRRIHTHGPIGAYGAWARRHHLVHHHVAPRCNHGVTTPLWDHVFGTWRASDAVRVPRRHAPVWMVHDGELLDAYQGDYELAGRR